MGSHAYRPGDYFRKYQAETIANEHQSDENDVEECNGSMNVPNVDSSLSSSDFFNTFNKLASKQQQQSEGHSQVIQ